MEQADPEHRICDELDDLSDIAAQEGLAERLDELIARARLGEDVGAALRKVLRTLGLPVAGRPRSDPFGPLFQGTWPGERLPSRDVYVCPLGLCSYAWVRRPGTAVPDCLLNRMPLQSEDV
ncbi:hypothetical protein [Micromonospora carbonacea]|uniref:Uncharacterized protein n=1 Tax=Micromonospora carbonacea TaxID=47853 RepID=A0A1C4YF61_9ACTN|nr:hypothetical protein [Micromonospora carbonacea]SCF18981.1 hypothetical protein GA0070563_10652 [Micromonospora carbonacea]